MVPNLGSKIKFIVHYKYLQLYLSLGMKLPEIHRVLKFKQFDWMKIYVEFNTKKRKNAANSFEKIFFKLMINSDYGKTLENLGKIINVRLAQISRPAEMTHKIFDKNYAAIHEIKPILMLNKPICFGFTILE